MFLLASLKTLGNSLNCSESLITFLFQIFFSHSWPAYEKFSGSQAAFGTTFRVIKGVIKKPEQAH
jgi:hypothetical protein